MPPMATLERSLAIAPAPAATLYLPLAWAPAPSAVAAMPEADVCCRMTAPEGWEEKSRSSMPPTAVVETSLARLLWPTASACLP